MLIVENLVKKYGDKTAVDGLSFHIHAGEVVGLLGLNGAGKSTTMNCITGYIAPTQGTITVDGADLLKEPDRARRVIGYLPEVFSYYPDMKVREYLNFVCDLKGFSGNRQLRKEHIETVCARTGLLERSGSMIRNLSKGYRQRVGLAQALTGNPKVLILDEPTVGLDPSQIIEIRQLIKDLGRENTVIVSSHILSEIQAICSRIIVIHGGHIVADGSTRSLLENTLSGALTIQVKAESERCEEVLNSLQCLKSFTAVPGAGEGACRYLLRAGTSEDIREQVFRAFSSAGLVLLEMSRQEESLEQLFLHLTGQDAQMAPSPVSDPQKEDMR